MHDAQRVQQVGDIVRQPPVGRQQPAGSAQQLLEQRLTGGLVERPVVVGHAAGREQRGDRQLLHAAVLTYIERGEVKAEGTRQGERVRHPSAPGHALEAGRGQRPLEQLEVRNEAMRVVALDRSTRLRCGVQQCAQPGRHVQRLPPDRLVAEPARGVLRQGHLGDVAGQRCGELRGHLHLPLRDAQLGRERLDLRDVPLQRCAPLHAEGPARDVGGDVRVAVPVAADPGAVAQERGQLRAAAVVLPQGAPQIGVDARHCLPDHARQEVQALPHLVAHLRTLGADLVGGEQDQHLVVERIEQRLLFLRRGFQRPRRQKVADPPLLLEHGAPAGLGGMGRERRLDVERREQRLDIGQRHAVRRQLGHQLADRLRARRLRPRAGPVDADDLLLLGLVHQVEERRERAQQRDQVGKRERGDALHRQLPPAGGACLLRFLAEQPQLLDLREHRRAVARPDRLAEHRPEQVHVLAQGARDPRALARHLQTAPAAHAVLVLGKNPGDPTGDQPAGSRSPHESRPSW